MIGGISALSIMCVGIVETFGSPGQEPLPQSPYIIAEYFSNHHETDTSGLDGPQGLMRSLIHQVLCQWPSNVPLNLQARRHESFSETREWSVGGLCQLFESIICQLPRELPIWCIIDNISHFETSLGRWDRDLEEIVCYFDRYVENGKRTGGLSAPIKFLFATASRSVFVGDLIPPDAEINLRDGGVLTRLHSSSGLRPMLPGNY
jgi:hypothetical protein